MLKRLLLLFGCALIGGGAFALFSYGCLRLDMLRVEREAKRVIAEDRRQGPASVPHAIVIVPPREGGVIGRIEIPRLNVSAMILEGTDPRVLRVAVGHIPGTALPGVGGNVALAAHRDTIFRPLQGVKAGDGIVMTTSYGKFRYVVDATEIVNPTDVRVLHAASRAELTLVTCYPFTYIGAAPQRFIVHAQQQP
jgi:sortase A